MELTLCITWWRATFSCSRGWSRIEDDGCYSRRSSGHQAQGKVASFARNCPNLYPLSHIPIIINLTRLLCLIIHWFIMYAFLYLHNRVHVPPTTWMSESTSSPLRRRRPPTNWHSQAEHYDSLALFLAARNLPVLSVLKHLAQEKDSLLCSNKQQRHVEHKSNDEVHSCLLISGGICHWLIV